MGKFFFSAFSLGNVGEPAGDPAGLAILYPGQQGRGSEPTDIPRPAMQDAVLILKMFCDSL